MVVRRFSFSNLDSWNFSWPPICSTLKFAKNDPVQGASRTAGDQQRGLSPFRVKRHYVGYGWQTSSRSTVARCRACRIPVRSLTLLLLFFSHWLISLMVFFWCRYGVRMNWSRGYRRRFLSSVIRWCPVWTDQQVCREMHVIENISYMICLSVRRDVLIWCIYLHSICLLQSVLLVHSWCAYEGRSLWLCTLVPRVTFVPIKRTWSTVA